MTLLLLMACERRPDVILLTVDTLRVDHVGAYGGAPTPAMDGLAARGIAFEQAFAPISVTGPSFATLHTGLTPTSHGVVRNVFRGGESLELGVTTLAELLAAEGYDTGAFVSGFTLRRELGLDQGFAVYDQPDQNRRLGDETADAAIDWLRAQWGPVFLWYHSYDPHGPLSAWCSPSPDAADRQHRDDRLRIPRYQRMKGIHDPAEYAACYAEAVAFADAQLQRLLQALEREGRLDRALIVVTADHGETFTERDLWFDHGTFPHEEQLHVPLLLKLPDDERAGQRVDALVGLHDVVPTLLEALELDGPAMDGKSLLGEPGHPWLEGESSHCKREKPLDCRPYGIDGKTFAVRTDATTVVRHPTGDGLVYETYDRVRDPHERKPSSLAPPEELKAKVDALAAARAALGLADAPTGGDDAETEALRALGYVE